MKNYAQILFDRFTEDWSKLKPAQIASLVAVKAKQSIPEIKDIDFTKKHRVKLGVDATGADLHIGHLVPFFLLNIFHKTGSHVDFLIGDFTAKIGDPSGRVTERAIITDDQIKQNLSTYREQVGKYIDIGKMSVVKNSEWLSKMSSAELFGVFQRLNLATAIQREDFRKRLETGGVSVAEVCYAALMGLDSVALKTTIEVGGQDQLLNFQQCREIQRIYNQEPEHIIITHLIEGLSGDGRKMGKSFNNYIAVNESAEDKFGKIMSMPDNLLLQYFMSFGYLYKEELAELESFIKTNPMEAKKQLATYMVAIENKTMDAGLEQRAKFETKFSKRELTDSDFVVLNYKPGDMLLDVLASSNKFKSKAELKTHLAAGAILDLDLNKKITENISVTKNMKIKVGKLNFFYLSC